ncbi:GDSL-type esterase/lipase family protein [Paenibacillus daejeonensis]|uniref:GDSL-type esterase/lipase family protein n=1 Tax=Paenibacillus daejeonensis TaxID=135193 RepID=UPI000368E4A6|nr:GDSL-type esterase/lipase family protein [Paenibacillus daejeonensis]
MRENPPIPDSRELEKMKQLGDFLKARKLADYCELNRYVEPGGIVFAGDSITEGFPIHELLRASKRLYNRGIGGDTTIGLLRNIEQLILDLQPAQLFLLIGTNDLGEGELPEAIVARIREICETVRVRLPDTGIVLLSIYPVNHDAEPDLPFPVVGRRTNEAILMMNQLLLQTANELELDYANIHDLLTDEKGKLKASYTYDGLHLHARGYEVVKTDIQSRLLS